MNNKLLPADIKRVVGIALVGILLCYWLIVVYASQFRTGVIYLLMAGGAVVAIIGFTKLWGGRMR